MVTHPSLPTFGAPDTRKPPTPPLIASYRQQRGDCRRWRVATWQVCLSLEVTPDQGILCHLLFKICIAGMGLVLSPVNQIPMQVLTYRRQRLVVPKPMYHSFQYT